MSFYSAFLYDGINHEEKTLGIYCVYFEVKTVKLVLDFLSFFLSIS